MSDIVGSPSISSEQQDILTARLKRIAGQSVDDEEWRIEIQAQKVHLVHQFYECIKVAYGLRTPEEVNYGILELGGDGETLYWTPDSDTLIRMTTTSGGYWFLELSSLIRYCVVYLGYSVPAGALVCECCLPWVWCSCMNACSESLGRLQGLGRARFWRRMGRLEGADVPSPGLP